MESTIQQTNRNLTSIQLGYPILLSSKYSAAQCPFNGISHDQNSPDSPAMPLPFSGN